MSRFEAREIEREGERVVELRDTATGAWAHVWPASGFNCVAAQVAIDGELVDLLLDPPKLEDARREPSHYGIPLLWPFPSGMPRGEYTFEGVKRQFTRHGHGFVLERAWKVGDSGADETGAWVMGVFESGDYPELREQFPFDYRVEAHYRLEETGLALRFSVLNTGGGRLPFGYGAHPYFKLPLGSRGSRGECLLHVPAARRWHGPALRAVSDGAIGGPDELLPPVPPELDLRRPVQLVERMYDGVWTDLTLVSGLVECAALDPVNGRKAVMRATPNHANVTVFTPAWAPGACFEPWTCPPNAFNLAAHGIPGHGLTVLSPGERWEGTMWLSIERL
ncbi:MAG TPA: aldose 1-epimerase [Chloroflexota bacterium]|nr:aldose 1-epimerase [Chloroflexota bacterium]